MLIIAKFSQSRVFGLVQTFGKPLSIVKKPLLQRATHNNVVVVVINLATTFGLISHHDKHNKEKEMTGTEC